MLDPGPVQGRFIVCRERRVTLTLQLENKIRQCIIRCKFERQLLCVLYNFRDSREGQRH